VDGISIPLLVALVVVQPGDSISSHAGTASHVVVPARNILHVGNLRAWPSLMPNTHRPAASYSTSTRLYIPSVTYHPDGWGTRHRLAGERFKW
jgi:hypothetical protein